MNTALPTLADLQAHYESLEGMRVVVRCDFNVPVLDGAIVDHFRITQALPTIAWLRDRGMHVRIISHISNVDSLDLVVGALREHGIPAVLIADILDTHAIAYADAQGSVIVFENIRSYPGEEANNEEFARRIAQTADVYVNEGFSVSHRAHASIVGVPQFLPAYAGMTFASEVSSIASLAYPQRPYVAIVGGAKFSTKLPLIRTLLDVADTVCVVGALAHDIYKARGQHIGASPHSDGVDVSAVAQHKAVWVPHDVVVTDEALTVPGTPKSIDDVLEHDRIVDAGADSALELAALCAQAGTVVWNGPLGFYEKGFTQASDIVARALVETNAHVVIGGGDTLAVATQLGTIDGYDFVSTGGGAMLDLMSNGSLPGIDALYASAQRTSRGV